MLYAAVFTVFDCGYLPRCAQEAEDGGEVRIEKIKKIIGECKFGIHDISRTETNGVPPLPRFNMSFELGIFLGARAFGDAEQAKKVCLVLDSERYRYQRFLSDIAGQDIQAHANSTDQIIRKIRNWLQNSTKRKTIPGPASIIEKYQRFNDQLPEICEGTQRKVEDLLFNEYALIASEWLKKMDPA